MTATGGTHAFPHGLIPVVQTPFHADGAVDHDSLHSLVDHAVAGGADGLLAPAVASEVAALTGSERRAVVATVRTAAAGRVPVIVGASAQDASTCREHLAGLDPADGYMVAVPERLYGDPSAVVEFFATVAAGVEAPLLVQDLRWNAPGLSTDTVDRLIQAVPSVAGMKIETVPAGPAYTAILERFGERLFVCAGWAIAQMIEALDRGVHAFVPESSILPVYRRIIDAHKSGRRDESVAMFRRLLPVIAYTNQELYNAIAFYKRLLVRKGVIATDTLRAPGFAWDPYNERIAAELIDLYLELEEDLSHSG